MKLRVWDRVRSALMGLLIAGLAVGAALFALGVIPDLRGEYIPAAVSFWQRALAVVVCVLLLLLGLSGVALLFRRRRVKGFVIQRTEYGDMSISMKAMENMVKKCIDAHKELVVNQTRIEHVHDGVCVDVKITLAGGVNIPLTVNALQKQIKQYITSCSGVDVLEVRVMVETDTTAKLTAPGQEAVQTAAVVPQPEPEEVRSVEEPEYVPAAAVVAQEIAEEPSGEAADEPSEEEAACEVIELDSQDADEAAAEAETDETAAFEEEAQEEMAAEAPAAPEAEQPEAEEAQTEETHKEAQA